VSALASPAMASKWPLTESPAGDRLAGILFIAFPLLVQVPFTLLSLRFGYPDVLRQPPAEVLGAFAAGGRGLVALWYAYAMSIAVFAAAVLRFDRGHAGRRTASWLALASALVQWIALSRWTFAVPLLAQAHATADAGGRAAIEHVFALQHGLLGVGLGEHLGQLLMAGWTFSMLPLLPAQHRVWRGCGAAAAVLFLIGLGEQLGTALQIDVGPLQHVPMVAFIAWSLWLVASGVHLLRR
jgi:Domain of unknown function (DUF4386)